MRVHPPHPHNPHTYNTMSIAFSECAMRLCAHRRNMRAQNYYASAFKNLLMARWHWKKSEENKRNDNAKIFCLLRLYFICSVYSLCFFMHIHTYVCELYAFYMCFVTLRSPRAAICLTQPNRNMCGCVLVSQHRTLHDFASVCCQVTYTMKWGQGSRTMYKNVICIWSSFMHVACTIQGDVCI